MNFFCVLIACVFVNVSTDILDFKRVVAITNLVIKMASDRHYVFGNGLEYIIKSFIYDDQITMEVMSILFAVPEKADLTNMQIYMDQQIQLQLEIIDSLFLPVPNNPGPNYGDINLTDLGEARRYLTGKALRNIIIFAIDRYESYISFGRLCRFLGVWISTKTPTMYITSAEVDTYRCCVLKDKADHITKYTFIDDAYWQVDAENIDFKIIELKEQLLEEEVSVITVR
ncbi:uncharacterized protein LOC126836033 isoform X2 [Adelges cooleyi]|uniref:uncharacterized protein LOC126836033 isoform X2 n=1 Tax=Adelges cooleyi TaxID=133065 RepID=UPI002180508C|nr:uncharacterized protein LOC126836033 isoform X2 [Adelges cooleyi]